MQVAQIILNQLGGNKFLAMTGASHLSADDKSLHMKIGRNAKKVTHCSITLNNQDTYDVAFFKCGKTKSDKIAEYQDIYAESLTTVFEDVTGLRTSL